MNKEEKSLASEVRKGFLRISREASRLIEKGLEPGTVSSSTTWGHYDGTYVRLILTWDRLDLEVVVGGFLLAEVSRRAKEPGIRQADTVALDKLVKDGPGLLVGRLSSALRDVRRCGGQVRHVAAMAKKVEDKPMSRKRS